MRKILKDFKDGKITLGDCEKKLKAYNILELEDFAKLDKTRNFRAGFPEVVYGEGKSYHDLLAIVENYFQNKHDDDLIITKLSNDRFFQIENDTHHLVENGYIFDYNSRGEILVIKTPSHRDVKLGSSVGIITAGTSDIGIAEESKVILEQGGCEVITSYDIGVAGIHRLFPQIANMIEKEVSAIIVCAGMEGTLPTVVAGLVDVPVIAVPTSIGYGIGKNGEVALNAMLQSCAPGMAVVNIDNGFGAAVFAITMIKRIQKEKKD